MSTNLRTALCAACALLAATWTVPAAHADEAEKNPPSSSLGVYCGLNTLYTILQMSGKDVAFQSLLKPEYLSSQKGSSLAELKQAAEDHGLSALPAASLTVENLKASEYPMILHVKKNPFSIEVDHYEIFLGTEQGQAILYDPPNDVRKEPLHQLLARWQGTALVLSTGPIDSGSLFWPARRSNLLLIGAAMLAVLGVRRLARGLVRPELTQGGLQRFTLATVQAFALVLAGVLAGLLMHLGSDQGLLAHAQTENNALAANFDSFFVEVGREQVELLLKEDVVIVDARYSRDYEHAHIEGAINIEPGSTKEKCASALEGIDPATPVIIYCQSAQCPFANKVGRLLAQAGYKNLMHYKAGWVEWKEHQ